MMTSLEKINAEYRAAMPSACKYDISLSHISYWKVGGLAKVLIEPKNTQELQQAIAIAEQYADVPNMIIGDSSNLLFSDKGYNGVIIKIGNALSSITVEDTSVYCEAGVWVPELAYRMYRHGLSGIEHTCGIPGRIGGLIYMNGGSKRRGILENVTDVQLINAQGELETVFIDDVKHSYRTSPFQGDNRIIASARLKLDRADKVNIRKEMHSILHSRRKRFPRKLPNCGSVFLSNPSMYEVIGPPGFAIEKAGLKGLQQGQAQISPQHANFIVNLGGASSEDIIFLISHARQRVFEQTGFKMDCEVRYVDKDGTVQQAHHVADSLRN